MMSDSILPIEPNSVLAHAWVLSVFRVEDHKAQQRVLEALRHLRRGDLTAVGTQRDGETFVIIDWDSASDETQAKQVVMAADRHAAITFTSKHGAVSL